MADQSHSGPLLEQIPEPSMRQRLFHFFSHGTIQSPGEKMVLTVTKDGQVIWHPNAEAMIADDSTWDESTAGTRHLLRIFYTHEKQMQTAKTALSWYKDEAEALSKHMEAGTEGAIMAGVRVLSLDGGKRATEALEGLKLIRGVNA